MTPFEAAQRLGVHETAVRTVEVRENDCVATLRDGRKMLVSETVARPYVPEVDDEPDGEPDEAEETEPSTPDKPKRTPAKTVKGKGR